MISVKPVKAVIRAGHLRVAAEISYGRWQTEKLWFDLPEHFSPAPVDAGNAWLTALLPLAFQRGQNLRICAPVNPVLLQNTEKLQQLWTQWFPGRQPVQIIAEKADDENGASGSGRTSCFFTGGVDSFFSLLHFDARMAGFRPIDDLIYVWGYDISLANRAAFAGKMRMLSRVAEKLGKNAIAVATNLRETRLGKLDWGLHMHGPALGAVGLLLGARYQDILVSSSQTKDDLSAWGTHQLATPLMSSCNMRFIYYGTEFYRFEKTAFIANSPLALENLHVCWVNQNDQNCGGCEKCYRTLLSFELLGCRPAATSFPQEKFSLERVKDLNLANGLAQPFFAEVARAAREKQRMDIVAAVEACLAANDELN